MSARAIVLALSLLLLSPFASSDGSFSRQAVLTVIAGAPAAADGHEYTVSATAGDVVTVLVAWASSTADLDLRVTPPRAECVIDGTTGSLCVADAVLARDVACARNPAPLATGPAVERRSFVAPASGIYAIAVLATVAAPQGVNYDISIDVDGAGGAVGGPTSATHVASPTCKLA